MSWDKYKEREQKLKRKCNVLAKNLFPEDKYNVRRVFPNPSYVGGEDQCIVDFRRKDLDPFVNCENYCYDVVPEADEEEYKECVEGCEENLKASLTGSVAFDPKTESIKEATIPGDCEKIWGKESMYEEQTTEEFEETQEAFLNSFRKKGCKIDTAWIHPHELIDGQEVEESPAICYVHTKSEDKKCKVKDVLKIVEENM